MFSKPTLVLPDTTKTHIEGTKMNLSVLENRLLFELPEEFHDTIQEEVARFESETSRMTRSKDKIGQATLNPHEISRVKTTNQHGTNGLTVIQLQVIKAYAIENGVDDWTSKVDGSLSKRENIELMKQNRSNTKR